MDPSRSVRKFTAADPAWSTPTEQGLSVGTVVDASTGAGVTVAFARCATRAVIDLCRSPSHYDQVLVVTRGRISVATVDEQVSARFGEVVFIPRGSKAELRTDHDDVELVTVTCPPHPPWDDHRSDGGADPATGGPRSRLRRFASADVRSWMHGGGEPVYFGDVIDETDGSAVGVTFIRWGAGEAGEFDYPLPYDEVFVVTRGSYIVRTAAAEVTAAVGEVIYLPPGNTGVYASDEGAELVAVTRPPYLKAIRESEYADKLEGALEPAEE